MLVAVRSTCDALRKRAFDGLASHAVQSTSSVHLVHFNAMVASLPSANLPLLRAAHMCRFVLCSAFDVALMLRGIPCCATDLAHATYMVPSNATLLSALHSSSTHANAVTLLLLERSAALALRLPLLSL